MSSAQSLPWDVRLMDFASWVMMVGFVVALVVVTSSLLLRSPSMALREVVVEGDLEHNTLAQLQSQFANRLAGSFLLMDLKFAQEAAQSIPWVRRAVVRREYPNRLRIHLREHRAVALWGAESEPRLLNAQGEVFEANTGEVEQDNLPRLYGPEAQAKLVLEAYQQLAPLFAAVHLGLVQLEMSSLGSWQARLEGGAQLQLGRGSLAELSVRVATFLQTLPGIAAGFGRRTDALESADLRHKDGYALKLRGVTTGSPTKHEKNTL